MGALDGKPRWQELPWSETYGVDGADATRTFLVPFDQKEQALIELQGNSTVGGTDRQHHPNIPRLIVDTIKISPYNPKPDQNCYVDPETEAATYTDSYLQFDITYKLYASGWTNSEPSSETFEVPHGYINYEVTSAKEAIVLPSNELRFKDDQDEEQLLVNKQGIVNYVPVTNHIITWDYVQNPPIDAIRKKLGQVNAAPFLGAKAGTLLFDSVKANRRAAVTPDGSSFLELNWKLSYTFKEKYIVDGLGNDLGLNGDAAGWSYIYDRRSSAWVKAFYKVGNKFIYLYPETDFTALFQEGATKPSKFVIDGGQTTL